MEVATLKGTIKAPIIASTDPKALGIIIIMEKRNQSEDIHSDLTRSLKPHKEESRIDVKRNERINWVCLTENAEIETEKRHRRKERTGLAFNLPVELSIDNNQSEKALMRPSKALSIPLNFPPLDQSGEQEEEDTDESSYDVT